MPALRVASRRSTRTIWIAVLVVLFCAAVASTSHAQTLTTLTSFDSTNGYDPMSALVQGADGNFYGTTAYGGPGDLCYSSCGTIFKITPSGTLTTLYTFCSQPDCGDGWSPSAVVQGSDGNFYGATGLGGNNPQCPGGECGTVFRITPSGGLTTLLSFNGNDGAGPVGLVKESDGNFYGATYGGGTSQICSIGEGCGTVFKITPSGTLTTLYNFCLRPGCFDGLAPVAPPVQGTDGNFYGMTTSGGLENYGTVYRLNSAGSLTVLYSFCSQLNCADGSYPVGTLLQGVDGNFYGVASRGGSGSWQQAGTVFKITPGGTYTVLYSFCNGTDCPDGSTPLAGLSLGSDGNFYGVTSGGGANLGGTIFKMTPAGMLTTLYNFCSLPNCTDGSGPSAALIQATNGNLYGTTGGGGTNDNCSGYGCGTVYSLSGPNPIPLQLFSIVPCRVVDTRNANGEFGGPPIQGGTYRSFPIPQGACNIPAIASAYSLNVTVAPHGPLGYLTIWPTGESQPYVSTMNSPDGRTKANAAIVPAGANGSVSVYVTDTTDVILDIDGYFTSSGSALQFYPLQPCRVIDTRSGNGPLNGPYLTGGVERDFPVLESPCFSGIGQLLAYSFNFTVVPHFSGQPLDYLTVWPYGGSQPLVSTLNNPTATVVANAAVVTAGQDGAIATYVSDSTDLIVDVNGYFAPGQGGYNFYPVAPCRAYDSRNNNGQPFMGERTVNIAGSQCAPPGTAAAYVFNATVVPSGVMPYLTLWPDSEGQPGVSTLNAYDGFITSNMAIVPNVNGSIDAYAAGLTQLILDISGYFAP